MYCLSNNFQCINQITTNLSQYLLEVNQFAFFKTKLMIVTYGVMNAKGRGIVNLL